MKKLLLLVTCLFTAYFETSAQAVQWAMLQNVTSQAGSEAPQVTSDGSDFISFGKITTSITFGGQTFSGNNGKNCYMAKHDETGQL